ncbi:hypothetical protein THAOC_20414, partial [Thalassiosira oceanica]
MSSRRLQRSILVKGADCKNVRTGRAGRAKWMKMLTIFPHECSVRCNAVRCAADADVVALPVERPPSAFGHSSLQFPCCNPASPASLSSTSSESRNPRLRGGASAGGDDDETSATKRNAFDSQTMSFLSPSGGDRVSPVALATAGAVGASIVVQLLTPADPFGKSARFLRQLARQ